jgi:hypothetical protein
MVKVSYMTLIKPHVRVIVADPHQFDADPDPACHFDANP